jgi:feruloyl esterase
MFHCNSGPGAWVIGQGGGASAGGIGFETEGNVLAAMVDWVENGKGPEMVEGTKFVNDTARLGIAFRRRHCRYPLRNTFMGGDAKMPDSWKCS